MRNIVWGTFVVGLLLTGVARLQADDAAQARRILDKAIQAAGGDAKLAKFKAFTSKGKGKINIMGSEIEFTFDVAVQPPKQVRRHIEADVSGTKFERTYVLNSDKGWVTTMGNTDEMSPEQLAVEREDLYAGWVTTLEPLKNASFQLAPLPEIKVGDRPAVGVKVSQRDHKDVSLYFDKDKGLLLKVQRRATDAMTGQEFDQETVYSDYKVENGMPHARRQKTKRDGNDFLDIEVTESKPVERLDANLFAKP